MTNSILMSIILMISIVMISCTNQPPPIPMPTPMVMVDERAMVMESLNQFNKTNNLYVLFLKGSNDIYKLETNKTSYYHLAYVASKVISLSLNLYEDNINNWNPPNNISYSDRLMEIKEAELYRIKHFGDLTEMMVSVLPSENDEAIDIIHQQFIDWRNNPKNQRPMNLQNDILIELEIDPESVNFMYVVPKELPTLPPQFNIDKGRS